MMKNIIVLSLCVFSVQGWTSDVNKTALTSVDAFEKIFGVTEGKRRNHTKGFCFEAEFIPNKPIMKDYSNIPLFSQYSKVIGRLSHKGGNNFSKDSKTAEYGMGLSFTTESGEVHRMSMNTLDFFPVATPEAFAELMQAKAAGKQAVKTFKSKNKDLQRFKKHMSGKIKQLRPYEGTTYNSVNSFYLTNTQSQKAAIRWSFIPTAEQEINMPPAENFFYENMQNNLSKHDIAWDMQITLANESDQVDNAAIPWSGEHEKLIAGQLKVSAISTEENGNCSDINYDPLVLTKGFEASGDPLLQARRAAYAISSGRRLSEKHRMK